MKIVCSSDWHLDASTVGLDRFEDVSNAAWRTAEEAIRIGADAYLFLGDLCDPDSLGSHRCAAGLAEIAFHLSSRGIAFRAISGNHDVVDDGHGTSTLSAIAGVSRGMSPRSGELLHSVCNVRVYERPSCEQWTGVTFVWLPYVSRAIGYDPAEFVSTVPVFGGSNTVVVAGHLMVPEAEKGSESDDFARGRDIVFPAEACRRRFGDRLVMLNGHYHRMQTAGGVRIPGSLVRLRFDEERNAPGFLVLEV